MFLNPYVAGNPVGGSSAFVGRQDVLRSVERMLRTQGTTALVLFGQRRIGKTSVLRDLEQSLPNTGPYKPVFFDLQDKAAKPLDEVLQQLAQRINTQLGLSVALDEANVQHAFQSQFIPDVLQTMDADNSLVILFDEFDVLDSPDESQAGAAFFPYLRDLLSLDPRLQFIFVIGRRPEDLSSLTLSVFKGIDSERVSLLSEEDTAALVMLAEGNGSLQIPEAIPQQIFALTGGHPYLTQQLCQEIWEEAHQDDPEYAPDINAADIEAAIEPALRRATNALEWLWDGLSPAQRIVAAALATEGNQPMSQERLEQRLQESGVRILVGELQDAPRVLEEWDLIEPSDDGYRFRTELLRRWIESNKPLSKVQEELDHIEPVAENLFQAAFGLYQVGNLDQAIPLLRQATQINPNHIRGTQVLSEILLAQGELEQALQLLRGLHGYNPAAARPRLIQVLLTQLKENESDSEDNRLAIYQEVLDLDPNQLEAKRGRQQIWINQIRIYQEQENYGEALILGQMLARELKDDHPDYPDIATLKRKTELLQTYQQAIGALEADDRQTAIRLLVEIIGLDPNYQEATRYLHLAVKDEDIEKLRTDFSQLRQLALQIQEALKAKEVELEQSLNQIEELRKEVIELRPPSVRKINQTAKEDSSDELNFFPTNVSVGESWTDPKTGLTYVPVPAGEFVMGTEPQPASESETQGWLGRIFGSSEPQQKFRERLKREQPAHTVYLDAYWIMQTPVTNVQYAKGVEAGACKPPYNNFWQDEGKADHPVTHIDWHQAQAFAEWAGGRLPTEAEWEKAARGTDGRLYPWGNEVPNHNLCNFNRHKGTTTPVGYYSEGASPYGALDMAGNVWEWVADWFDEDYYAESPTQNPQGPKTGSYRVLRGGSWHTEQMFVRAASRLRFDPNYGNGSYGFRVVRAASPGS